MSEELQRKARPKGTPKKQMPKNSKKKNEMLIFAFQKTKNMAFIKFIIIAVGIYYLLKWILKAIFPFLVKKTFDKMQEQANQQQQQTKKEGEVTIDKSSEKMGNSHKKDVGDYVDFEEVDD